jgi:anti-anti-sigma factor
MRDSILQIQTALDGDRVVIRCAGELDFSVAGELREAVDAACSPGIRVLRMDMSELGFIDSSGLQCLLEAHVWCESNGATFEVVPSRAVQRVLDIAGALFSTAQPDTGTDDPDRHTASTE